MTAMVSLTYSWVHRSCQSIMSNWSIIGSRLMIGKPLIYSTRIFSTSNRFMFKDLNIEVMFQTKHRGMEFWAPRAHKINFQILKMKWWQLPLRIMTIFRWAKMAITSKKGNSPPQEKLLLVRVKSLIGISQIRLSKCLTWYNLTRSKKNKCKRRRKSHFNFRGRIREHSHQWKL